MDGNLTDEYNWTINKDCTPETDIGGSPIAMMILIPFLLSLILLFGAATLDAKDHVALKIALFIISIIPFFISLNISVQILTKYYNFSGLEELLGSNVLWFGSFFAVIIIYFLIYTFVKLTHNSAQKKEEELKY